MDKMNEKNFDETKILTEKYFGKEKFDERKF